MLRTERVARVHEDRRQRRRIDEARRGMAAAAMAALEPLEQRTLFAAAPTFMIGTYLEPNFLLSNWASRGVNTAFEADLQKPDSQATLADWQTWSQAAVNAGLFMVRPPNAGNPATEAGQSYLSNVTGWLQPDEPDLNGVPTTQLATNYQNWASSQGSDAWRRPVYLNFSGGDVLGIQGGPNPASYYPQASSYGDVVGQDFYPITGWGATGGPGSDNPNWLDLSQPDSTPRYTAGTATQTLAGYAAPGKPEFAVIETGNQYMASNRRGPTAAEFNGELWDAIIDGAQGIVYFSHVVGAPPAGFGYGPQYAPPNNMDDDTPSDVVAAMTQQDARITSLASVLASPVNPAGLSFSSSSPTLEAGWRRYNGQDYFIVENRSSATLSSATFTLGGESAGSTATDYDSHNSFTLGAGATLTDSFQPYQTHIYQLGTQSPPPPPPAETSYLSPPPNVTDTIQAENFDNGGQGVAYNDLTATNDGGAYRPSEGVDIESTGDTGGGYDVGWTQAGEWMNYIVNVPAAGSYTLNTRVANPDAGGSFDLQVQNGGTWQDVSGATAVPQTGAWQTYQTVTSPNAITLTAGQHILRLSMDAASSNGYVGNFNWLTLTPTGPTPAAPTNLSVTTLSNSSLSLSWTDNANNETSYVVQRATSQSGPYTTVATLGANATSYTDTGLGLSATYYYEVTAVNAAGSSAPASGAGMTSVPNGPFGLSVTPAGSTELDLAWYDSSINETNFVVQRSTSASGPFSTVATLPANTTSYADTGLSASTTYYYNVFAENAVGDSGSTTGNGTTDNGGTGTAPAAPAGVATRTNSNSAITVSWNASAGATSYAVLRATSQSGPYSTIATLGAGATSYGDTGLALSATYYYEVQAINSYGSNTSAPVAGMTSVPNGPFGLSIAAAGAGSLQLNWYDNSVNETEFVVERATSPNGTYSVVATLAANTTSWLDTGLSSGTTYYYQVFAANDVGYSGAATGSGTTS